MLKSNVLLVGRLKLSLALFVLARLERLRFLAGVIVVACGWWW